MITNQQILDTLYFYHCPCDIFQTINGENFKDYYLIPLNGTTIKKLQARVADFSLTFGQPVTIETAHNALVLRIQNEKRKFYDFFSYLGNIEQRAGQVAIGITPYGSYLQDNLFTMPHLLVSGTTGAGKSNFIHNAIISLADCGGVCFRLIDLKRVELSIYNGCPFMVSDCVTDATQAEQALQFEVLEMENRYKLMEREHVNHYTQLKKPILARVIIIDELADLMLNRETRKSVEQSIVRIAQLGRAAGVHLIVATQRPDTTVITGLIKANIPSRLAFTTASAVDSRVIGVKGAENLTGKGDAIYHAIGKEPERVQAFYFDTHTPQEFINLVKQNQRQRQQPQPQQQPKTRRGFFARLFG